MDHGARKTLSSCHQDCAGDGAASQPVGRLHAEEDDHKKEGEGPDTLACKDRNHGVDSGNGHDTPRLRLAEQSLPQPTNEAWEDIVRFPDLAVIDATSVGHFFD